MNRTTAVAGGAALGGVAGLGLAAVSLASIPAEPAGDGFVAGLAVAFSIGIGLAGLAALGEAAALTALDRWSSLDGWGRQLLLGGAMLGGGSVLPLLAVRGLAAVAGRAVGSPLYTLYGRLSGPLVSLWFVCTLGGIAVTTAGVLAHAGGTLVD